MRFQEAPSYKYKRAFYERLGDGARRDANAPAVPTGAPVVSMRDAVCLVAQSSASVAAEPR